MSDDKERTVIQMTTTRAQVDQRALVDKILARYSGKFTLFRELLQNADDAEAQSAEIRFETAKYQQCALISDPKLVVQWTFRNNGKAFDERDWRRLPMIAAGNPDPDKIGAFGVGFYSVFSVTDNPSVSSGGQEMLFYWKPDDSQLYISRNITEQDSWTAFKMPLREPRVMLSVLDLMRFLASSIIFMANLNIVGVFLDNVSVGQIRKTLEHSETMVLPADMQGSSRDSIMNVNKVQSHRIVIETEISGTACGYFKNKASSSAEATKSRLGLTIFTADVDVNVDEKLSKELNRCTKKGPPSWLKYSLIYTGKVDHDRNSTQLRSYDREVASIFRGLDAELEEAKHTRIFIGHATGQTTSIGGHMASRFIPTVERESIDFVDPYVSIWNNELLRVGGFLCRAVHELELFEIKRLWEQADSKTTNSEQLNKSRDDLLQRFLHVLQFFAFHDTTPSPTVANVLRQSFYDCSSSPIQLLSSVGVRMASEIRAFDLHVAKFINTIPMLPENVTREASRSISSLPERYKISPVTVQDVLRALGGHPLSETQLNFCLQWWFKQKRNDSTLRATDLLKSVSFYGPDRASRPLSRIEYFINTNGPGSYIPRDGPLPASLIPLSVSMHFTPADLVELGWKELAVADWFQHIACMEVRLKYPVYDMTKSVDWAGRVLYILSRAWPSFPEKHRCEVKKLLGETTCIPTDDGLRRPGEAYLPISNISLFRKFGLQVITLAGQDIDGDMRELLLHIGAQPHIPLELLFERLLYTREWSVSELMSHLVRLSPPLNSQQVSILRESKRFSKESSRDKVGDDQCYYPSELYPPVEVFRKLQLPVIDWNKRLKWSDDSSEAKLLYQIGLNRYPPLSKIIDLCAASNGPRELAFTFFCTHLQSVYTSYNPKDFQETVFVPAENKGGPCWKSPREVFLGIRWKTLGLSIVRNDREKMITSELGSILGMRQDPPPSELLSLLETNPPSYEEAREWYECLSEHIQAFTQADLVRLSGLKIVPKISSNSREWLTPVECYLGRPANDFYSKLFVFVDFEAKANHFLAACGSMKEPSIKDVAEKLVQDPERFYRLSGTPENFLEKLRELATRRAYIPNDTLHRMSGKRTLLGECRLKVNGHDTWKHNFELRTPEEIVIVDDPRDYELFGDVAYVAPPDELLQRFYSSIGCRRLSSVIHEQYKDSPAIKDTAICFKIRKLILERLDSFLKKCTHYQFDQKRDPRSKKFSVIVCESKISAVAKPNKDGSIELWLSKYAKQDMYDLAASLCRLLFGTVKDTDIFLLAAMLSSDVELLKRAGFNVDQFSQQTCESLGDMPSRGALPQLESALDYVACSISDAVSIAQNAYRKAKDGLTLNPSCKSTQAECAPVQHAVIHQNYIREIVTKAASGSGRMLDDNDDIVQFLKNNSCNDFAHIDNLQTVGITPKGIRVHVAGGVPDVCAFIAGKQELLARFVDIAIPAASAHKLPIELLHIFYEVHGGPIAFNLEGDIYLNLRNFEEWHDEDVQNGYVRRAQLSWFFVLAHEIAHNLIPLHDAAHAFWFAAICEEHISDLFEESVLL